MLNQMWTQDQGSVDSQAVGKELGKEGKAAPMLRKFCSTGGRCAVKEKPALLWVEVLITVAGLKEFDLSAGISAALPTKPSSSFSSLFGVNPKGTL